jgi:4-aminobutyrate aminotransferase-like enzyme
VPLIFDECQTFGWVPGHTLAGHWGVEVDMLCLGKGLAGGLPLAACVTHDRFDNLNFGDADYTNGGHNFSVAAMEAVCRQLTDSEENSRFLELCTLFEDVLGANVGDRRGRLATRGIGLIRCIEIRHAPELSENIALAQAVCQRCLENGVYVRPYGPCIGMKPPRTISRNNLFDGVHQIFEVIDNVVSNEPALRSAIL